MGEGGGEGGGEERKEGGWRVGCRHLKVGAGRNWEWAWWENVGDGGWVSESQGIL